MKMRRAVMLAAALTVIGAWPASASVSHTHSINHVVTPGHRAHVEAVVGADERCALTVQYADGRTQEIAGPQAGIARTYIWRVPLSAARGTARVQVACEGDPFIGDARFWVRATPRR